MSKKRIALIGGGQIGGNLALLAAQKELGDIVIFDIPKAEGMVKGKALDLMQLRPHDGYDVDITGTSNWKDVKDADVFIITAGIPRKPGMDYKTSGFKSNKVVGMAGALDSTRFRTFIAMETGFSVQDVTCMVLGGHGDTMVPITRLATIGGVPLGDLISEEKITKIEERTRFAGGEIVKLFGNGSAFYAPAQSAIEMAESYLRDKKRVIPCATLCNGEFGIDGYFIGVPTVIGSNGVEKILEFKLKENEQEALNQTLEAVKKTVSETGL